MTPNPHGKSIFLRPVILGITAFALLSPTLPATVHAQDMSAYTADGSTSAPTAPVYSQQQLDQMLAPIALYPDTVVGQVLMAATYPPEIVEAYRWQQDPANAALQGDQLAAAMEQQPWDPSVKSLTAFPQLLKTLNDNLQWTEQLGDAFLAQQAAVTESIQRLRQRAESAGTLTSTPQQTVTTQDSEILITPTNPDLVYIPTYNPAVVYGAWPYVGYPPYYFPGYAYYGNYIGFGIGFAVIGPLWGWSHWDWGHHRIDIDDRRFGVLNRGYVPQSNVWQHDPDHRRGVPYRDAATRAHFQSAATPDMRRNYRGYGATAPQNSASFGHHATPANVAHAQPNNSYAQWQHNTVQQQTPRPAVSVPAAAKPTYNAPTYNAPRPTTQIATPRAAPVYESFSRGAEVQAQSARGAYSRSTMQQQPNMQRAVPQQQQARPAPQPQQQHASPQNSSGGHSAGYGGNNERR